MAYLYGWRPFNFPYNFNGSNTNVWNVNNNGNLSNNNANNDGLYPLTFKTNNMS